MFRGLQLLKQGWVLQFQEVSLKTERAVERALGWRRCGGTKLRRKKVFQARVSSTRTPCIFAGTLRGATRLVSREIGK